MIVTTWRSGSTFFGEMLANDPKTSYFYEPLRSLGERRIRYEDDPGAPIELLRDIIECRLDHLDLKVFEESTHLWQTYKNRGDYCHGADRKCFEEFCLELPISIIKTTRLHLALVRSLLEDPKRIDLRIVYLVRDPRAVMKSRYEQMAWCKHVPDCIDHERLCYDIDTELDAFHELSAAFPGRLSLVQYEPLALKPLETIKQVYDWIGLNFTDGINATIREHTSKADTDDWSTFRNSVSRINKWQKELPRRSIDETQSGRCRDVLPRLGLELF